MNLLKLLVAGAAIGVIVIAFRDTDQGTWIAPPLRLRGEEEDRDEAEPVLGYDGMDVDALIDWMDGSAPDRTTLERMRAYETAHLGREGVLTAIADRL